MPEAADILASIDRIMAELQALRAAVAASELRAGGAKFQLAGIAANCADDFAPEHLVEISTAAARWNRPPDTVRHWCRREGCGVKIGGRWLASVPRIKRRLNGE